MRILMIEDDPGVVKSVELMLGQVGYEVHATDLGHQGAELAKLHEYDLVILDLDLPDTNGHSVLRELRSANVDTPVLILSGRSGMDDRIEGLGSGADDYLPKPFHKEELIARIEAVIRRAKVSPQTLIKVGNLAVNLDTQTVEVNGQRVGLTGKEYAILELLARRKGAVLSREMLMNQLYSGIDEPEPKILDVYMCKIRKKIADADRGRNYIETVWGRGYMLREPDKAQAPLTALDA